MELKAVSHLDHWLQALHLLMLESKCWGSLHHALLYVILLSVHDQAYIWFFRLLSEMTFNLIQVKLKHGHPAVL
jgi:hypothetical protein